MASSKAVFIFLACLFAAVAAEDVNFTVAPVQKLVDYQYNFPSGSLIPGLRYNGSVVATWAVPQAALASLSGKSITVKISASASNSSPAFFVSPLGSDSYETEAYLRCNVQNASCANSSILSVEIPLVVLVTSNTSEQPQLTFKSEVADSSAIGLPAPGSLLDALASVFSQNSTGNSSENASSQLNLSGANFLDSFKPEGNGRDPIAFLKQNQLISLTALAIVVIITGAYLLNSRD